MLPHLSLRFADQPLAQFRPGGREPFRPSEVDRVTIRNRELVRVELLSGDKEDPAARFNLFIDPERMLVERVEGDEWLPGGLHHQTTVRIENHEIGVEETLFEGPEAEPNPSPVVIENPLRVEPTDRTKSIQPPETSESVDRNLR
jgi:hypothetical protein